MFRLFFILAFFYSTCASGQIGNDTPFQLWMDITEEGSQLEVQINFISESRDLILLNYLAQGNSYNNEISSKISKSGEFLAAQNLPIPLSTISVPLQSTDSLRITIRILQEQQLMLAKDFFWTKPSAPAVFKNDVEVAIQNPIANKKELVSISEKEQKRNSESKPKVSESPVEKVVTKSIPNYDALEIQGLIIDETRSKIGRDYYEIFYNKWIPPQGINGDFNIQIIEMPSFGRGARVSLKVNDQTILTQSLSPRFDQVDANVNRGIRTARSYLVRKQKESKDLEESDQSGSGLF